MTKTLILFLLVGFSSNLIASGCDSLFFQRGTIIGQKVIQDFGQADLATSQNFINRIADAHKNAIHYWDERPIIDSPSNIKLITTIYSSLDTDCGWTKYGLDLSITHLEITSDQGVFFYPDIYKNIYPEFLGPDELIEITLP